MWAAKTSVHEFERACKRINVCAEARSRILPFVHMHERAHIWHNQSAPSQEYLGVHECKQAWLSLILIQCLYTWSVCVRLSLCVCLCAWGKNVGYSHSPPQPPASSSENGEQGCVHQQCAEPCKPGSGLVSLQLLQLLACVTSTYAENKAIRPWPQRTSFRHMPPFPLVLTYKKELSPPWGGGGWPGETEDSCLLSALQVRFKLRSEQSVLPNNFSWPPHSHMCLQSVQLRNSRMTKQEGCLQ